MNYLNGLKAATAGCLMAASSVAVAGPVHNTNPEYSYAEAGVAYDDDTSATSIVLNVLKEVSDDIFIKIGGETQVDVENGNNKLSNIEAGVGVKYDTAISDMPTSIYGIVSAGLANTPMDSSLNDSRMYVEAGIRTKINGHLELNAAVKVDVDADDQNRDQFNVIVGAVYHVSEMFDLGIDIEDAEKVLFKVRYHFGHKH